MKQKKLKVHKVLASLLAFALVFTFIWGNSRNEAKAETGTGTSPSPSIEVSPSPSIEVSPSPSIEPSKEPSTSSINIVDGKKENSTAPGMRVIGISNEAKEKLIAGLTDAEKEQLDAGNTVDIYIKSKNLGENAPAADKAALEKIKGKNIIGMFMDLSLCLKVGSADERAVSNPGGKIKIGIDLPESLANTDVSKERVYYILHVHDGETEIIETSYDDETGLLTFETDGFSTFALAYNDIENDDNKNTNTNNANTNKTSSKKEKAPKTGDESNMLCYFFIIMISGAGAFFVTRKKENLSR